MYIARGSLAETKCAFVIAESLGYCNQEQLNWVTQIKDELKKVLMVTAVSYAPSNKVKKNTVLSLGIGDWVLGIGD